MLVGVRKKHWLVMSISVTGVLLLLVFNVKGPTMQPIKYVADSSEVGFLHRRIATNEKELIGDKSPQVTQETHSEDHTDKTPPNTTPPYIHLTAQERVAYAKEGILMVGNDLPDDVSPKVNNAKKVPVSKLDQKKPSGSKEEWQKQIQLQRIAIQKQQKLLQEHHLEQQKLLQQHLYQPKEEADKIPQQVGVPAQVNHQSSSMSVVSKTSQVSQTLSGVNTSSRPSPFRRAPLINGPLINGHSFYYPRMNYASLKDMGERLLRHTVKREFAESIRDTDFIPGEVVKPSQVRRIIILSTWRSGSSFLGDLLRSYPATFFSFEPLHQLLKNLHLQEGPLVEKVTDLLRSILTCDYSHQNDYINYMRNNSFLITRNTRLWNSCSRNRAMCFDKTYISKACSYMPVNVIKTVRMGLSPLIELLQDPSLDLRVIHLVRDPRGSLHSRMKLDWCKSMACSDPETVCNDLTTDLKLSSSVKERFPDRYLFIRYEDLSLEPEKKAQEIVSFLNLTYQKSMASFVKDHTSLKKSTRKAGTYSTFRDSRATTFSWREGLNFTTVENIQEACKEPLQILGLRNFQSEEEYTNMTIPVLLT